MCVLTWMISDSSRCHTALEQPWKSEASVLPSPRPKGALPHKLRALPTPAPSAPAIPSAGCCCCCWGCFGGWGASVGGSFVSTMTPPSQSE